MNFDSYITSETKTAISLPLTCPPPYKIKGFGHKRKAFTLAETLITLTIIGVVAALTIPTLMSKYQKHQYVAGLKKAYSTLSNAVQMIPISEGCSAGDYSCADMFKSADKMLQLLSKQLKTTQTGTCYHKLSTPEGDIYTNSFPCIYTNDGMTFMSYNGFPNIWHVDVNGNKNPNELGRDVFTFSINTQSGTVKPYGASTWKTACKPEIYNWDIVSCTARVLEEGAMNY